ncbi:hypothetical protein QR680_016739 [Steinernema hermaphroditum]|uniref:Uncharacterized protein n=1 Tax=Steinernema hermaphroditum TaxID=289476 RepID=A0AA39HEK8_9BILA|nr:hypothetical protein QR680_016739 [Steinernema hermaphroditum]
MGSQWNNFGERPCEVTILYPFIFAQFPHLRVKDSLETVRKEVIEKTVCTAVVSNFEKTRREVSRKEPQKWTISGEAKRSAIERDIRACLPGGFYYTKMKEIIAEESILQDLVDGTWGPRDPSGDHLPESKEEIEQEKTRKRRTPEKRREAKQGRKE